MKHIVWKVLQEAADGTVVAPEPGVLSNVFAHAASAVRSELPLRVGTVTYGQLIRLLLHAAGAANKAEEALLEVQSAAGLCPAAVAHLLEALGSQQRHNLAAKVLKLQQQTQQQLHLHQEEQQAGEQFLRQQCGSPVQQHSQHQQQQHPTADASLQGWAQQLCQLGVWDVLLVLGLWSAGDWEYEASMVLLQGLQDMRSADKLALLFQQLSELTSDSAEWLLQVGLTWATTCHLDIAEVQGLGFEQAGVQLVQAAICSTPDLAAIGLKAVLEKLKSESSINSAMWEVVQNLVSMCLSTQQQDQHQQQCQQQADTACQLQQQHSGSGTSGTYLFQQQLLAGLQTMLQQPHTSIALKCIKSIAPLASVTCAAGSALLAAASDLLQHGQLQNMQQGYAAVSHSASWHNTAVKVEEPSPGRLANVLALAAQDVANAGANMHNRTAQGQAASRVKGSQAPLHRKPRYSWGITQDSSFGTAAARGSVRDANPAAITGGAAGTAPAADVDSCTAAFAASAAARCHCASQEEQHQSIAGVLPLLSPAAAATHASVDTHVLTPLPLHSSSQMLIAALQTPLPTGAEGMPVHVQHIQQPQCEHQHQQGQRQVQLCCKQRSGVQQLLQQVKLAGLATAQSSSAGVQQAGQHQASMSSSSAHDQLAVMLVTAVLDNARPCQSQTCQEGYITGLSHVMDCLSPDALLMLLTNSKQRLQANGSQQLLQCWQAALLQQLRQQVPLLHGGSNNNCQCRLATLVLLFCAWLQQSQPQQRHQGERQPVSSAQTDRELLNCSTTAARAGANAFQHAAALQQVGPDVIRLLGQLLMLLVPALSEAAAESCVPVTDDAATEAGLLQVNSEHCPDIHATSLHCGGQAAAAASWAVNSSDVASCLCTTQLVLVKNQLLSLMLGWLLQHEAAAEQVSRVAAAAAPAGISNNSGTVNACRDPGAAVPHVLMQAALQLQHMQARGLPEALAVLLKAQQMAGVAAAATKQAAAAAAHVICQPTAGERTGNVLTPPSAPTSASKSNKKRKRPTCPFFVAHTPLSKRQALDSSSTAAQSKPPGAAAADGKSQHGKRPENLSGWLLQQPVLPLPACKKLLAAAMAEVQNVSAQLASLQQQQQQRQCRLSAATGLQGLVEQDRKLGLRQRKSSAAGWCEGGTNTTSAAKRPKQQLMQNSQLEQQQDCMDSRLIFTGQHGSNSGTLQHCLQPLTVLATGSQQQQQRVQLPCAQQQTDQLQQQLVLFAPHEQRSNSPVEEQHEEAAMRTQRSGEHQADNGGRSKSSGQVLDQQCQQMLLLVDIAVSSVQAAVAQYFNSARCCDAASNSAAQERMNGTLDVGATGCDIRICPVVLLDCATLLVQLHQGLCSCAITALNGYKHKAAGQNNSNAGTCTCAQQQQDTKGQLSAAVLSAAAQMLHCWWHGFAASGGRSRGSIAPPNANADCSATAVGSSRQVVLDWLAPYLQHLQPAIAASSNFPALMRASSAKSTVGSSQANQAVADTGRSSLSWNDLRPLFGASMGATGWCIVRKVQQQQQLLGVLLLLTVQVHQVGTASCNAAGSADKLCSLLQQLAILHVIAADIYSSSSSTAQDVGSDAGSSTAANQCRWLLKLLNGKLQQMAIGPVLDPAMVGSLDAAIAMIDIANTCSLQANSVNLALCAHSLCLHYGSKVHLAAEHKLWSRQGLGLGPGVAPSWVVSAKGHVANVAQHILQHLLTGLQTLFQHRQVIRPASTSGAKGVGSSTAGQMSAAQQAETVAAASKERPLPPTVDAVALWKVQAACVAAVCDCSELLLQQHAVHARQQGGWQQHKQQQQQQSYAVLAPVGESLELVVKTLSACIAGPCCNAAALLASLLQWQPSQAQQQQRHQQQQQEALVATMDCDGAASEPSAAAEMAAKAPHKAVSASQGKQNSRKRHNSKHRQQDDATTVLMNSMQYFLLLLLGLGQAISRLAAVLASKPALMQQLQLLPGGTADLQGLQHNLRSFAASYEQLIQAVIAAQAAGPHGSSASEFAQQVKSGLEEFVQRCAAQPRREAQAAVAAAIEDLSSISDSDSGLDDLAVYCNDDKAAVVAVAAAVDPASRFYDPDVYEELPCSVLSETEDENDNSSSDGGRDPALADGRCTSHHVRKLLRASFRHTAASTGGDKATQRQRRQWAGAANISAQARFTSTSSGDSQQDCDAIPEFMPALLKATAATVAARTPGTSGTGTVAAAFAPPHAATTVRASATLAFAFKGSRPAPPAAADANASSLRRPLSYSNQDQQHTNGQQQQQHKQWQGQQQMQRHQEDQEQQQEPMELLPVVCGSQHASFDPREWLVQLTSGKRMTPNAFEKMSGKGACRNWKKTVRIAVADGSPGITLKQWLAMQEYPLVSDAAAAAAEGVAAADDDANQAGRAAVAAAANGRTLSDADKLEQSIDKTSTAAQPAAVAAAAASSQHNPVASSSKQALGGASTSKRQQQQQQQIQLRRHIAPSFIAQQQQLQRQQQHRKSRHRHAFVEACLAESRRASKQLISDSTDESEDDSDYSDLEDFIVIEPGKDYSRMCAEVGAKLTWKHKWQHRPAASGRE